MSLTLFPSRIPLLSSYGSLCLSRLYKNLIYFFIGRSACNCLLYQSDSFLRSEHARPQYILNECLYECCGCNFVDILFRLPMVLIICTLLINANNKDLNNLLYGLVMCCCIINYDKAEWLKKQSFYLFTILEID